MSRFSEGEPLRSEDSVERPTLRIHELDNVVMQQGSLAERVEERDFDGPSYIWQDILKLFSLADRRKKVALRLVEIPVGYTEEQAWEMISVDPAYQDETGELLWEKAKIEHATALDADSRLSPIVIVGNLEDEAYVVAAGSSYTEGDDYEGYTHSLIALSRSDDGERSLGWVNRDHRSRGHSFLLLVRKSKKR